MKNCKGQRQLRKQPRTNADERGHGKGNGNCLRGIAAHGSLGREADQGCCSCPRSSAKSAAAVAVEVARATRSPSRLSEPFMSFLLLHVLSVQVLRKPDAQRNPALWEEGDGRRVDPLGPCRLNQP
jgi:hypothetical protein